jgi:hypothetical protein
MDPVTVTIVSALAAGAAAGATDVATNAIKDAYAGLKSLIVGRYGETSEAVDLVTANPASKARQAVLAEELEKTGAVGDGELKEAAQALLDAVSELRAKPGTDTVFDFDVLHRARNVELEDIDAAGTVFRAREATLEGDFKAKGIRQKLPGGTTEKK